MAAPLPERATEAILADDAASYFGPAGRVFVIRGALPPQGRLHLTEETLHYLDAAGGCREIPLSGICGIGMGRWHEPSGSFLPVLKIVYDGNLVFGVHVAHPERWMAAFETLAAGGRMPGLDRGRNRPRRAARRSIRLLVAALLVAVLVLGALPQALSRLAQRSPARLAGPGTPAQSTP